MALMVVYSFVITCTIEGSMTYGSKDWDRDFFPIFSSSWANFLLILSKFTCTIYILQVWVNPVQVTQLDCFRFQENYTTPHSISSVDELLLDLPFAKPGNGNTCFHKKEKLASLDGNKNCLWVVNERQLQWFSSECKCNKTRNKIKT